MFADREEAGRRLAADSRLTKLKGRFDVIIFGIPRGGVVTAAVLARGLAVPFDAIVARKISSPGNPEFAIGALTALGPAIWNEEIKRTFPEKELSVMEKDARGEAVRRLKEYSGGRPIPDVHGKTVVLVDDGLATGLTMRAVALHAKQAGAKKIIVAVPVAPRHTVKELRKMADQVVVVETPDPFYAVGQFYRDFPQVDDQTVKRLLAGSDQPLP